MKNRILYIDNLKALAIFCVLIGHVYWFTWNHADNVWTNLISTFYMPLFFFISGAFAKDTMALTHLGKKAKQLLLPYFTVGGLFTMLDGKWHELFFGVMHHGYWFLPTLFTLFSIFYFRCLMTRWLKIRRKKMLYDIVYVTISFCVLKYVVAHIEQDVASLFCLNKAQQYLLSFFGGYIVFSNKTLAKSILNRWSVDVIYALSVPLFVGIFYVVFYLNIKIPAYSILLSFLAIFILFVLFRTYKVPKGKIQNAISYVGQHTLEIYVLQYFFLPISFIPTEVISGGGKFFGNMYNRISDHLNVLRSSH